MCIHLTKAHMHHSATYDQHALPALSARYLSQRERAGLISRQEVRACGASLDRVVSDDGAKRNSRNDNTHRH